MSLRIACDLDGTLADMEGALQRVAAELFGSAPEPILRNLTPRQLRDLWGHVTRTENFWTSLAEIEPGAVASLSAAAGRHRWEVVFLTQRPPTMGDATQVQSQRWLEAMGFEYPAVVVAPARRGRIAAALGVDVVLDDRVENCLEVVAMSKACPYLVWRGSSDVAPAGGPAVGIRVVFSIAEAIASLEEGQWRGTPVGLAARLRKALGF